MSFVAILLIVIAALFTIAFFTRRRFGVLGLALAAGATLSAMWVGDLTPIIAKAGIIIVQPPLSSVVAVALTLLPAVLLLSSGPVYRSMLQRVVGSSMFAVLAIAFLLPALGSALVIDGVGQSVYAFFVHYHTYIITAGLMVAVIDVLISKTSKRHKEHDKH